MIDDPSLWKTAIDPKTGRTYWYHRKTRESTWSKPECLIRSEKEIANNVESSSSSSSSSSITNDKIKIKSPLQQLQEQTQAMFKKQFNEESPNGSDDGTTAYSNVNTNNDHYYDEEIDDDNNNNNNVQDNDDDEISTLITDLTSKSIDTRENSVRLLLSYCIPSMMSKLSEDSNLMTNLVSVIMQCQKGLDKKRDSYIRRTALRCLWSLSTDASVAAKTFHTNQSWTILCEFVPTWEDLESGLIFVSMMSLLLSSVQFVISDDIMKDLCIWMESRFFESSKPKHVDLDVLIAHPSPEGLSIIDVKFLHYFSVNAHYGQGLPGLALLALLNLGFQTETHAVWLIRNGGLDALHHVCSSPKVNNVVRSQSKKTMLNAMSSSSFVRERILDMSINFSSSFANVPYPQGPDPLGTSCLSHGKIKDAFVQEWIPDQEVDGLKRDVEFRPKSGGVGWFLCSSILWVRCPALRESLENYWSDEANDVENNDPLLISVNASAEVLASLCKYLHTGLFLPPHDSRKKLELYAVASQLEMPHLASLVGDAIINCLSECDVDDTIEFCKDFNLNELERACRTFKVAAHKPTIHFNTVGNDASPGGSALKQAIMASLNDVTELLYKTSPAAATASIAQNRTPIKDDSSLIYEDEVEYETSDSDAQYRSEKVSNKLNSKKTVKSGGIYSLLLQDSTNSGISNTSAVQIDGTSRTPPGKSKKVAPSSSKVKPSKPSTSKTVGKLPPNKPDATPKTKRAMALLASSRSSNVDFDEFGEPIEFDRRMSMLPEPELSEREKRLQHIARPRIGGASKEKPLEDEPAFEETEDVAEDPIVVKPSSSPPRETFLSKTTQSADESTPQRLQHSVRGSLTLLKTKARRRRSIADAEAEPQSTIDDDDKEPIVSVTNSISTNIATNKISSNNVGNSSNSLPVESKRRNSNCIRKAGCQCSNCIALASISLQQPMQSASYDVVDDSSTALFECGDCGRKFNGTAYEKHVKVCKKVFVNSRKQFDMTKQRIQDDEQLRILQNNKKQKETASEKSAKWKNQSQAFREAMKAARDVSHAISTGAPLPPPTISAPDPSLIPCPHCGRRFNEKAAERHIPLCTSIKAKPTMLSKGGGLGASAGVSLKDKKKNSTW